MIDDLAKNVLEDNLDKLPGDKTQKVAKKALSGYDKAQKVIFYIALAKWSAIGIIALVVVWGGYSLVTGLKDMVTEAAVEEVKVVANEKIAAAKVGVAEKKAAAKAKISEAKRDDTVKDITSGILAFAKNVDAKFDEAVDGALAESGFDPDAPANCALQSPESPSSTCLPFSNVEVGGDVYTEMKIWDGPCPTTHARVIDILKTNGKVTHNEYRKLQTGCHAELDAINLRDRDSIKNELMNQ